MGKLTPAHGEVTMLVKKSPLHPIQIAESLSTQRAYQVRLHEPVHLGDLSIITREMDDLLQHCEYLSVIIVEHGMKE